MNKLAPPTAAGTYISHLIQGFPVYVEDSHTFVLADGIKHYDKTVYLAGGETADSTLVAFLVPEVVELRKQLRSLRAIFRAQDGTSSIVTPASFQKLKLVRKFAFSTFFSSFYSCRSPMLLE